MASRLQLHEILCDILGTRNVYFQPPESVKMKYPAIVYSLINIKNNFADNRVYRANKQYEIIVIDKNPDSEIVNEIMHHLPIVSFNRHYKADNLNHYVFTVYFY